MEPVEIAAGRVQLRPWAPSDESDLVRGANDPEVTRFTGLPAPYTEEHARAFVSAAARGWADGTATHWAVRDAVSGSLLASVGLMRIGGGEATISYWTMPEARGQGATVAAVAAVCRFGFAALGVQRIGWGCCIGNFGSRAVAQKVGFTIEGSTRQSFVQRGVRVDDWVGSLLATDPMVDTRPLPRPPVLTDGVVTLRGWTLDDAPDVARACDDAETARWLPVPSPYSLEDAVGYLDGYIPTAWAEGAAAELAVTDTTTGELLGAMGLKLHNRRLGYGEIGYWTAPWARGRGAAGRGAALSAAWGLRVLGLSRVELLADVRNAPSQRAAEKAGFAREGVARRSRLDRNGVAQDMVLFSLTTEELDRPADLPGAPDGA